MPRQDAPRAAPCGSFLPLLAAARALFPACGLTLLELDPTGQRYAAWHSPNVKDVSAVEEACLAHCGLSAKARCPAGWMDSYGNWPLQEGEPVRFNSALIHTFQSRVDGLRHVLAVLLRRQGGRVRAEDEMLLAAHAVELVGEVDALKESVRAEISHVFGSPVLESAPLGIIALSASGKVGFINARARHILARLDSLRVKNGRLEFPRAAIARTFQTFFLELSARQDGLAPGEDAASRGLSIPGPRGEPQLALLISPFRAWSQRPGDPVLTVFVSYLLDRTGVPASLLATMFSLSQREAQLAELLGSGLGLEAAAQIMRISRNTARIHLSSIFGKTKAITRSSSRDCSPDCPRCLCRRRTGRLPADGPMAAAMWLGPKRHRPKSVGQTRRDRRHGFGRRPAWGNPWIPSRQVSAWVCSWALTEVWWQSLAFNIKKYDDRH